MPAHGAMPIAGTWSVHGNVIGAIVAVGIAILATLLVDRLFARRQRVARVLPGGQLTPVADTRLRVLRRVIEVVILGLGAVVALGQFQGLDRIAASVFASGAITAAVVGFAARQTLANAVAGLLLAITQPLRIGDLVCFQGQTGTVEDVRLTYTYLRTGDGSRIVIPNEQLASGVLRNDTILDASVGTEVSLWVSTDTDAVRAVDVLRDKLSEATVSLAELTADGARLSLSGPAGDPSTRAARESDLRARAFSALRGAGLR